MLSKYGEEVSARKSSDRTTEALSSTTAHLLSHLSPTDEKALSTEEVEAFKEASETLEADADFRRLAALLSDFNLFEALGIVRQELRHSHWLAFLLQPSRSHGLGGALLYALCGDKAVAAHLDKALRKVSGRPRTEGTTEGAQLTPTTPSPSGTVPSVRNWDWSGAMVVRESEDLDLLVVDQQLGLAIIIENKIDAPEHGDQLDRYFNRVGERYPGLAVAGLFLTPQGTAPSDKRYLPVSYGWVCGAVEKVRDGLLHHSSSPSALAPASSTTLASKTTSAAFNAFAFNTLQPQSREALALLLSHYIHLLRRHIVDHPELPDLCNELYQRHAPLLDLLFEHRGDDETRLYRAVQSLVSQGAKPRSLHKLVAKSPRKTIYPKFGLREWEALSTQANGGEPLERSALYFEFTLRGALRLNLLIGPYYDGKPALDDLRSRVLLAARNRPDLFTSGPLKSKSPLEKTPQRSAGLQSAESHSDEDLEPIVDAGVEVNGRVRPNPTTTIIWRQTWISPKRFAALSHEEHVAELESRWQQFLDHDLPQLRAALPAQLLRVSKSKTNRPMPRGEGSS